MINLFKGIYKTPHVFSIAPQEPDVELIKNACLGWAYDENTHEFTFIRETPGFNVKRDIKICLDDYDFETDKFGIALMERSVAGGSNGESALFTLLIKPIHPTAHIKTLEREFIVSYAEAERLSRNPAEIPDMIAEKFSDTEPFDISIIDLLYRAEGFSRRAPWLNRAPSTPLFAFDKDDLF